MTSKRDFGIELDALKKDIEALRRKSGEDVQPHLASAISSEFNHIRALIDETLDTADSEISEHPVLAMIGAMAFGFLIGRIAAR